MDAYKVSMNPLNTDLNDQKPLLSHHKTSIMYSDIILQTFDAFQIQQGILIKAQHVAKNNTHHRSEQRHRLLNSLSLGHTPGVQAEIDVVDLDVANEASIKAE